METVVQFFTLDRSIEAFGLIVGLFYLYWEYHANAKMWVANIVMTILSFWVYYRAGLYADFGMNIYYFIIAIYGFIVWTRHKHRGDLPEKNTKQLPVSHIPVRIALWCLLVLALIYAAIAYWLINFTDSNVPYLDAFTTALSIVATWMLARKYIEQWWAWVAVDAVTVGLCIYKDRPFYAVLYAIYTVIAFFGYAKWKRLLRTESAGQAL